MKEEDLAERPIRKVPTALPKGTNPEDRSPWNPGMRIFRSTTVPIASGVEAAMAEDGGQESSPETAEDRRKRVQQVGEAACSARWYLPPRKRRSKSV